LPGLVLALGAGCASSNQVAPGPDRISPEDPRVYYPLDPGWKWAYDVQQDGDQILAIYSVASREGDRAVIETSERRLDYVFKPDGIVRGNAMGPPDYVLKAPIKMGARWPVAGGEAQITAVGATVEVIAGRFPDCIVVEEIRAEYTTRTTFAPGVGPVKIDLDAAGEGAGVSSLRAVLRGFTRPGEDPLASKEAPTP
jgi:hypothetical protein